MKKILYIGNNIKASNPTTIVQLSILLKEVGFEVVTYSNKQNKGLRLLEMCIGVFQHRNARYILIDTYSTANFYFALIVSQLARVLKIAYIPILHGGNLPKRLHRNPLLSKLIFKNSYLNVAPSRYLKNVFEKQDFKTVFIPNMIHLNDYEFKARIPKDPKLLWVRAFDKIYNPEMAIQVLFELKKTHANAMLCMVGPDKDGSLASVQQKASQLGVLDSVEFTGLLSKKVWVEKSKFFDIFINTTNVDNTPISVIEAMALGLPVISTNVGGLPYLIKHGGNGFLVAENDAEAMASSIIDLMQQSEKIKEITTNARKTVNEFDVEIVQQQWINLLK